MTVPDVDSIDGLPPATALQQRRGTSTTRSSLGSMTMLSNLLWMLYSWAGTYPRGAHMSAADFFFADAVEGACSACHGIGRVYDVTQTSLLPDAPRSIRERAIAAWPSAWHGQISATFASHQALISMPRGSHRRERIDSGCLSRKRSPACPCTLATMRPR